MTATWAEGLDDRFAVRRDGTGVPLDESGSVGLAGPDPEPALVDRLRAALATARSVADAALSTAAAVGDGERVLPTALGGEPVWHRAVDAAESAAVATGDPYAVVVIVADEPADGDRWTGRSAAALQRSLRAVDVVVRTVDGFAVLAPRCDGPAAESLAWRLTNVLLDVGVGAVARSAAGPDLRAARASAHRSAVEAERDVWRL